MGTSSSSDEQNRFRGAILGLACGDALGAPTEFLRMGAIREHYGESGITALDQTDGRYTDDTQMAEALALGLLDAYSFANNVSEGESGADREAYLRSIVLVAEQVGSFIAKRFYEWSVAPYNTRAPGVTCMRGCAALGRGVGWWKSGIQDSKGCGSVMRSGPVGLVYAEPALREIARASSIITHGHPAALDAAHLGALAIRLLLDGEQPRNLPALLHAQASDEGMRSLLMLVREAVGETVEGRIIPERVMSRRNSGWLSLGESWVADEALASALYCFLLALERDEGYVETVRYGANTPGDSDSIAAIAGQFAGVFWGAGTARGVPQRWAERVERGGELRLLADRLYEMHQALYAEASV